MRTIAAERNTGWCRSSGSAPQAARHRQSQRDNQPGKVLTMPEYLAPGVFVEESSSSPHPIAGVPTSTAGFVGPVLSGPAKKVPALVTSLAEYEVIFGDATPLRFADGAGETDNYLWHAARAFFAQGGMRLYVARTFSGNGGGAKPTAADYATALRALEAIDEIAVVAAPGSTASASASAQSVAAALIAHAESMRYRIAVIDSVKGDDVAATHAFRTCFDSGHAALYYPWVRVADPLTGQDSLQPPSGFVAGIYARNDITRAVYKAPANAPVKLATGFERLLTKVEQDVLNPLGINCFRYIEGRGLRLWGARTLTSAPDYKYVNVRRYMSYLEHSIDKGTGWAAFEPNDEPLWAGIRRTIGDFLYSQWRDGGLLGDTPEKAFFVKCDRTTMTQSDIDNSRLVMEIGVAPLRPAEFVILRIGQWTADKKPRGRKSR
jgi:phage tail sheath protein FI